MAAIDVVNQMVDWLQATVESEVAYSQDAATDGNNLIEASIAHRTGPIPGLYDEGAALDKVLLPLPSDTVERIQQKMQSYTLGTNFAKDFLDQIPLTWVSKYFPATVPGGIDPLLAAVTQSLVTEIQQEIIWARAKSQGVRDNARSSSEAVSEWASRGFSLPGGVLVNMIQSKEQDLNMVNADIAAQQAIKALDIWVDGIKFAADISVKYQLGLINGFNGLITAYSKIAFAEMGHNSEMTSASNQMFAAITGYYGELNNNANMENKYTLGQLGERIKTYGIDEGVYTARNGHQTSIATNLASTSAQIASAALGGLHSVASAATAD